MITSVRVRRGEVTVLVAIVLTLAAVSPALALQPRHAPARFDDRVLPDPGSGVAIKTEDAGGLSDGDPIGAAWRSFASAEGGWRGWIDPRSGLPSLAIGRGIEWMEPAAAAGSDPATLDRLETSARQFMAGHEALLGSWAGQLSLDRDASGKISPEVWQVTFRQTVAGVPVDGARYDFHVRDGSLVAYGATRWAPVRRSTTPRVGEGAARSALLKYLGIASWGEVTVVEPPSLRLVAVDPARARATEWQGRRGDGWSHLLVWKMALTVPGEPATWVAEVDADGGQVVALYDDARYGQVRGGVFPLSDDGICPSGCEQTGYPLPFATLLEAGGPSQATSGQGFFTCQSVGATLTTALAGPYIRVQDNCGAISESTTCDNTLDLRSGPGTDCAIPTGSSPGNTHASRSSFYHLNRAMEKGRAWLPDNNWLKSQVTDNVNINSTCNAYWNGSVNFYRSGGGCRNTGEIAGVFVHEWGHGIDQNDGGGYDNPSEAYADIVALLESHESCVGRGFFIGSNCSGYGDPCLNCTGIRDQDWDMHVAHAPATPAKIQQSCGGGGDGPCGGEGHCESYLAGETIFDLATRDLPASGMDAASSWQLAEKLFYLSRKGSGGDAYHCSPPNGDSCGTATWYHRMRVADDDDGDLGNGTPHAAAIFAAYARHGIACGAPADPTNQSTGSCPVLVKPEASAIFGTTDVQVSWTAVSGAASYRILRTDIGCDRAQIPVASVPAPAISWIDGPVAAGLPLYYRVQAVGAVSSCESPVSDCASTAEKSPMGAVRFDQTAYGCSSSIGIRVVDGNASGSVTLAVSSDTETVPETVTLLETLPGSRTFVGSIPVAPGAPVPADGLLSASPGDLLTATYRDADDGSGHLGMAYATARVDCTPPSIDGLSVISIADDSAVVYWTTSKPATGRVDWGATPALGNSVASSSLTPAHSLPVKPLSECGRVYFRVFSTDAYGNTASRDVAGSPFGFNAYRVPGVLWSDDFESSGGWTLEGEWQIGAPQGKGTAPGDPARAFRGTGVLGHDLTGLGSHPGDYEPQKTERAASPTINASALSRVDLRFRRWLNAAGGIASVEVKSGGVWNVVWDSMSAGGVSESDWSLQVLDISSWAAGNPQLQIAFKQLGGPNATYVRAGWNVDRILVKDGSLPEYATCGACGGAPTFAGVTAAADNDACAITGVTVTWPPAPAWGTGSTGTYSIYRGTTPGFTPSDANRVATGVAGTSWNDTAAPEGAALYYLVRAENDETCSTGSRNHGMTDGNTVYAAVTPTSSRPSAGPVPGLAASLLDVAHVRLVWGQATNTASYGVYRSAAPSGGFTKIGVAGGTSFDDVGAGVDGMTWYYQVRAVDPCGRETP